MPAPQDTREIYTVARLTAEVRLLLERELPLLWVEGEISNLARPASGHWYFTLKDASAQLRCAMFRGRNRLVDFRPESGQQVLLRGRVSLYEQRGDFQLVAEHMEPAGLGALQRAFEQLKQRLAAEGLFAEDLKRPLPPFPRRLAVVSSPTGAALRDVLSVLARRFPALEVRLYPVPVQGAEAAGRIAAALARAGAPDSGNDLVLLTRGGGSLEDLWAFNEEVVARAIHACALPVVCGVGHEVDVTIADFAADLRAPTPSAAAELIVPDAAELDARFARMAQRLGQLTHLRLERYRQRNTELGRRLERCHPRARLEQRSQRLDELDQRLRRTQTLLLEGERRRLAEATRRLGSASPALRIADLRSRTEVAGRRLVDRLRARLEHARAAQASAARALHALSPLATLARGYAIVSREDDGRILLSSSEAAVGDRVRARLAEGELSCRVEARQDPPQAPQRAATARKRGRST